MDIQLCSVTVSPDYDSLYTPPDTSVVVAAVDDKKKDDDCFQGDELWRPLKQRLLSIQSQVTQNQSHINDMDMRERIMDEYGDDKIVSVLKDHLDEDEIEKMSGEERLSAFMEHLKGESNNSDKEDLNEAALCLSGVLEYMTESVLAHAGCLAKENDSVTPQICTSSRRSDPEDSQTTDSKWIIRPHHIQDAMQDDSALFWWQETASQHMDKLTMDVPESKEEHLITRLSANAVRHIICYFENDPSMLASLSRVDRSFYVLSGTKRFWKPIINRCYVWNPSVNPQSTTTDLRALIASDAFLKYTIANEHWIQLRDYSRIEYNDVEYILFSRLHPSIDYLSFMQSSIKERRRMELTQPLSTPNLPINEGMHDCLHRLMEFFGPKNAYFDIATLIDNSTIVDVKSVAKMFEHSGHATIGDRLLSIENGERRMVRMALSISCNRNLRIQSNIDQHWLFIGSRVVIRKVIHKL